MCDRVAIFSRTAALAPAQQAIETAGRSRRRLLEAARGARHARGLQPLAKLKMRRIAKTTTEAGRGLRATDRHDRRLRRVCEYTFALEQSARELDRIRSQRVR